MERPVRGLQPIARELPTIAAHKRAGDALGLALRERISNLWSAVSPVRLFGTHEYSDAARPLYGAFGTIPNVAGEFPSLSITANTDIVVYQVLFNCFGTTQPRPAAVHLFTPGAGYVPFINNVGIGGPALRPNTSFEGGSAVLIGGTNPLAAPAFGPLRLGLRDSDSTFIWAPYNSYDFPDGLVVPTPTFLTLQVLEAGDLLNCAYIYRQVG